MAKARNLKFGMQIDYYEYYSKYAQFMAQKGRGLSHVTYF